MNYEAMRKRILIYAAISAILAAGCDDAPYGIIENAVYISEAAPGDRFTQQVENQTVDGTVEKTITVRLAKAVDSDVTVTLGIDEEMLDTYNSRKGTSYMVLPEEYRSFDSEVTIPAGSISAVSTLTIRQFQTPNGEAYAIPLTISSVTGPVTTAGDARHILYLLMAPHFQKTPLLNPSNAGGCKASFTTPVTGLSEWTVEFWMKMTNTAGYTSANGVFYGNSSPVAFSDLYLRWWPNGAMQKGPCFQNQMTGVYFDDNTEAWKADTWYHVAYTYDGSLIQMYIDGQKNANKQMESGKTFSFGTVTLVGGSWCYGQACSLAQIRMWDKCLSQASLQDAMNRGVPSDSPGLFGYWKCDEGEGSLLKDSSPGCNDIQLKSAPKWSDEINFLHPNG